MGLEYSRLMARKCKHCGFSFGSHNTMTYWSDTYKRIITEGLCPSTEGRMDWDNNTTIFEPLEEKEEPMIKE